MANRQTKRAEQTRVKIENLKANRRTDLLKMAIACFVMVLLIVGKTTLEMNGLLEQGNVFVGGALMLAAFGLAVFAGSAGVSFAKNGRLIKGLLGN